MTAAIARRALSTIVTLFGVAVVIFVILRLLPGNAITASMGASAGLLSPAQRTALDHFYGIGQPAISQFTSWLGSMFSGNLGVSLTSQTGDVRTVASIIAPRLRNTILLAGLTAVIAIPLAVSIGILSATYRNSRPTGQFGWSR